MSHRSTFAPPIPVTPENFLRAESDRYFTAVAVRDGGFGKFSHKRELSPIDRQNVIRQNRDTLYSAAVFDLEAGPVTVTLPDAGGRFMSLQIIDEDQYVPGVYYDALPHRLVREEIGTRYAMAAVRTLVDPEDPADLARARALQDAIRVDQIDIGSFAPPTWDYQSQDEVRDALLTLARHMPDTGKGFGPRGTVDPVQRLIGGAAAWGANPPGDAMYVNATPTRNDGQTAYRLTVKDVPVDAFWSVIVYDAKGFIPANGRGVYSFNSLTAGKDADGSITIRFGGEDTGGNCIPIAPGWNYMVRLYRPRREILDGSWSFPMAQPID
ncbi:DUF1254 domain-containing protein [Novosphingobium sp. BL-8H]|uniref:DUF1254 domain-containing protein n=1 Tax=Novosphingobium sp. BL-8H TaxID=3127640 RepID=UPI0037568A36